MGDKNRLTSVDNNDSSVLDAEANNSVFITTAFDTIALHCIALFRTHYTSSFAASRMLVTIYLLQQIIV